MAKAFSVVSWNVKHFKNKQSRVDRVVNYLKQQNPEVFALYEVVGKDVFTELTTKFPGYTFQITEGVQTQEILVGVKNALTVFFTQRTEFKSGTTHMRPGLLATITIDDVNYGLLFLHLASSTDPRGMGLRDDMLYKSVKFRKSMDDFEGGEGKSHYIFLGDLNTMGMYYPDQHTIEAKAELKKWDDRADRYYGMRRLGKTHDVTWSGGSDAENPPSNLDHVYASTNLQFKLFKDSNNNDVEVSVRGWVDKQTDNQRDDWIIKFSDHSLLYFEVQRV